MSVQHQSWKYLFEYQVAVDSFMVINKTQNSKCKKNVSYVQVEDDPLVVRVCINILLMMYI